MSRALAPVLFSPLFSVPVPTPSAHELSRAIRVRRSSR
jgi:hypothetical protein